MRSIQTQYGGVKFRSRLEVRWAMFFDELGWVYEYERRWFCFEDGTKYLPDFYLPTLHTWVEVKPDDILPEDVRRCVLLSSQTPNDTVMIANGYPENRQYRSFIGGGESGGVTLSSYIRMKGWSAPYSGGDWEPEDVAIMEQIRVARYGVHF